MNSLDYAPKNPRAFQGFVEGVRKLNAYLESNVGGQLAEADQFLSQAIDSDPDFLPAQYYKSIVLTHERKSDDAIRLLEGLLSKNPPFQTEVLYNLAFAYAKKYKYDSLTKSIELAAKALDGAKSHKRTDLILLLSAIRAWIFAVFAGRPYGHPENFDQRKREYLPQAIKIVHSVLKDSRLPKLPTDTQAAITVEAQNAAGIAFMRLGQFSSLFPKEKDSAWQLSLQHYVAALSVHPHDVRVLDNISSLRLLQASKAIRDGHMEDVQKFATEARDRALEAISFNPGDQFRHYRRAQAEYLLGNLDGVHEAAQKALDQHGEVGEQKIRPLLDAQSTKDLSLVLDQNPTD
jgi:tetratricopeptide (TPR) repeat protein